MEGGEGQHMTERCQPRAGWRLTPPEEQMSDRLPHHANLRDGIPQPPPNEHWITHVGMMLVAVVLFATFANFAVKAIANSAATRIQAEDMIK